jgi:Flp pilus assembly protein TadG
VTSARGAEDGSSPITAVFGVAIFLGFLFFAVQVLVHLYATSAVTAAAFDVTRAVAADGGIGRAEAEQNARDLLGEYGASVRFRWSETPDEVVLRVTGPTPAPLIQTVARLGAFDGIEREVRVRKEGFRDEAGNL